MTSLEVYRATRDDVIFYSWISELSSKNNLTTKDMLRKTCIKLAGIIIYENFQQAMYLSTLGNRYHPTELSISPQYLKALAAKNVQPIIIDSLVQMNWQKGNMLHMYSGKICTDLTMTDINGTFGF